MFRDLFLIAELLDSKAESDDVLGASLAERRRAKRQAEDGAGA